jgi:hypothetical protein
MVFFLPFLGMLPLITAVIAEAQSDKRQPACPECDSDETVYVEPGIAECRLCLRSFNIAESPQPPGAQP